MGPVAALPAGQPRAALVAEVAHTLAQLPEGAAVVVACSGGPDSTALAFLVAEAREDLRLTLVHVAHGLRDSEVEDAERRLVAQHGSWLGVASRSERVRVPSRSGGPEAAARTVRYAALEAVADALGATAILLGHTADDQAETVLLRTARGTGNDGLAGMRPRQGRLLRPLLRLRRCDVHAFVTAEGVPTAHDASNDDPAVRRSVVRHHVLPALAHVAPDPVGALTRLAVLAHDDAEALDAAARPAVPMTTLGAVTVLQRPALRRAHRALARRRIRDALAPHLDHPPAADTVARVLAAEPGTRCTLPGAVQLEVTRAVLVFAPVVAPVPPGRDLAAPGRTAWPELDAALETRTADSDPDHPTGDDQLPLGLPRVWAPDPVAFERLLVPTGGRRDRVQIALPRLPQGLRARPPQHGDRIRTVAGTRRVAAVLRDAHLPRTLRARWPVVVSADRVVWVPGFAVDGELADLGRRDPKLAIALVRGSAAHAASD
ncbi:MAG: tRNA lysidine(34) synthetase TilS [Nitriliruptoraceae bacterium]